MNKISADIFTAFYCHIGRSWHFDEKFIYESTCISYIYRTSEHLAKIIFHTHANVISLLLVVLLFITQLQQQFFPLTYFLSITIGYSPPGYCCWFALIVFNSQKWDWRRYQRKLCSHDRFFSVWEHPWPF